MGFPGKEQDPMEMHDKLVSTVSFSLGAQAFPIITALLLSGCGNGHKQGPAKPDAGKADSGADVSPGPEAGPEVLVLPAGPEAGPDVSVLPAGPEAGPEVSVPPTDPESCAKATTVPTCEPGAAIATISSAAGAPLLAKIAVTSGLCIGNACPSGCASLSVLGGTSQVGSTCDLEVTSMNGRSQSVRLNVVQNPAPAYACCSYSGAPYSGHMVALDPTTFSPSTAVVDFAVDGGVSSRDGGSSDGTDAANGDTGSIDASVDVSPGQDTGPDVYVRPSDQPSCVKATNVPSCSGPGPAYATVSAAPGGPLMARIQVTSGSCSAYECFSECSTLVVQGNTNQSIGATCDLLITSTDGHSQSVRITVVQNPSAGYLCCGYPLAPYTGTWVTLDPVTFSPSLVVVDFGGSGGEPALDGGARDVPFSE
jgi:hypothetical protein